MCAVEMSWRHPDDASMPLGNADLAVDADYGPLVTEPTSLATASAATVVAMRAEQPCTPADERANFRSPYEHKSAGCTVTALTFCDEPNTFFSAHEDGFVKKWNVSQPVSRPLWSVLVSGSTEMNWDENDRVLTGGAILGLLATDVLYCWGRTHVIKVVSLHDGRIRRDDVVFSPHSRPC